MEILQEFWLRFSMAIYTISWNDILDIAVVSFLIYKAVQLVRDSRAMFLLKGLLVLGIVYAVVRTANLTMMQRLFDSVVLQVGVIAVIVLFQQEIRGALEKIGRSKLADIHLNLSGETQDDATSMKQVIDDLGEACVYLQEKKMGALIVIEGTEQLNDVIESGTVINADSSSELIGNIFFNKSPLHDGAMIIRDKRIYAAGCILPLTQNVDISSDLGTRHRAAIGMSEASDAIVIVVSEETGTISLVEKGKMRRNFTKETLKQELEDRLVEEKTSSSREIRFFSKSLKREEKRDV